MEIEQSEVVTNQLAATSASKSLVAASPDFFPGCPRQGLAVRDGRAIEEELRAIGEELSKPVVQQYVYQKLMDEMRRAGFNVVEEETNADHSIRLKVRHWEN